MSSAERIAEKEETSQDAYLRQSAERYALNAYNLRPLEGESSVAYQRRFVSDIASAIIEMGESLPDRTNPVVIPLRSLEELARRSRKLRNEAKIDQAENRAFDQLLSDFYHLPSLFSLEIDLPAEEIPEKIIWEKLLPLWPAINSRISQTVLWISPPSPERGKKGSHEARLCFYFKGLINNEPHIITLAVCSQQTPQECLNFGIQVEKDHGSDQIKAPETEEDLRKIPLLLSFPEGEIWRLMETRFREKMIFSDMAEGKCFEHKIEAFRIAQKVFLKVQKKLSRSKTADDYFYAGVEIERVIYDSGIELHSASSCGESYLDSLLSSPEYTNPFGDLYWTFYDLEIQELVQKPTGGERAKYIVCCGNCKMALNRYMAKGDTCPYCDGVYQGC